MHDPQALARQGDTELFSLLHSLPLASARREAVYETLVRRYDFLVRAAVRRYRDSPEPVEDLTQAGYLGLVKAISNFDPGLGTGLRAYAEPCISGEIKKHFRDKRWQVRVQRPAQELMLVVRQTRAELTQELGRLPDEAEIIRAAGLSAEELREAQSAESAFRLHSLDAPAAADGDAEPLGELIGQEDPGIEHALDMDAVWAHWAELPERQQRILAMRFYGNMTQEEIGQRLGISQMHVSRLLAASLGQLRRCLLGEAAPNEA
jgi:RNA polymerase sigma-B factor